MASMPNLCSAPRVLPPADRSLRPSAVLDLEGLHNRCHGEHRTCAAGAAHVRAAASRGAGRSWRSAGAGDAEQIARIAHRIKGTSANVSAKGLQQAAAEIEDLSHAGRVSGDSRERRAPARRVGEDIWITRRLCLRRPTPGEESERPPIWPASATWSQYRAHPDRR